MCQQWWESWGSRKHYLLKFSLEISPDKKEIKRRGMSCKNCADIGGKSCLARHVTWNMLLADLLGQIMDNLIINWAISSEQSLIGVLEDIILQWYMSIFSQILNTDFQPWQYLILRMCFASYLVGLSFEVSGLWWHVSVSWPGESDRQDIIVSITERSPTLGVWWVLLFTLQRRIPVSSQLVLCWLAP